jgi:hypothetical protein
MKKILYISGLLLLAISLLSCSDDFLSENNWNFYTLPDTLHLNNSQDKVVTSVQLPVPGNADYTIFMQPKWLSFSSMHGKVTDGIAPLSFTILKDKVMPGYQIQYGIIMLDIDNFGLISFMVAYSDFGSPTLQCSASSLTFESSISLTFTLRNSSEGILKWEITGIPDWLIISATSGSLNNGNSGTITASLNLDSIDGGEDLSGLLQITSNSTNGSYNIAVHVPANAIIPSEVMKINGIVTDAEYNHQSGIMAICTKSPNSLIVFNTTTGDTNTVSLDKTPNCVSLSEDGKGAAIGYSVSSVSYIDIENLQITREYTIDSFPSILFWGIMAGATSHLLLISGSISGT